MTAWLHVMTRQSRGGLNQQAIAAIENALLDIAARARGIPVYALFGGPIRERIPVYWSHFGSYRVRNHAHMGTPPLPDYDEVARHAAEVKALGFKGLKTNILIPGADGKLYQYSPGFGRHAGWPELNWDNRTLALLQKHLRTIRDAVGPEMNLHLDTNFHFRTEGFQRVAEAVADFDLTWLEIDTHDAAALGQHQARRPLPHRQRRDAARAARIPPLPRSTTRWMSASSTSSGTGWRRCMKIAAICDVYEVNCAPHNFYGNLCSMISAHFSRHHPELPGDGDRHRQRRSGATSSRRRR